MDGRDGVRRLGRRQMADAIRPLGDPDAAIPDVRVNWAVGDMEGFSVSLFWSR